MFSSGLSRTRDQSYGIPKGLSFRIFKGPSLSSTNFPSLSGYAGPGPYTNATAHFDVGYHPIPMTDPARNRRTSLYPSRTSPGAGPPPPPATSVYTAAQLPTDVSSTSSSQNSSGPRSSSNLPNSNPSKNQRQFSIYASNTNKDTYIYEASDIYSNSEYSSSNATLLSPSPAFSPALSTDSTVTLRSPLSSSSLLEPPNRSSNRTPGISRLSTSGTQRNSVPPLAQAQDALRNILGTPAPQNPTSRVSPPTQRPHRRDSINVTSVIPFSDPVSGNDAERVPALPSCAENDISESETESDRVARRNAEINSGYSSHPAFGIGRRRTLSTLSNISSNRISIDSMSANLPLIPEPVSYFPPPEPLPIPPRPASPLSFHPESADSMHITGTSSSFHHTATDPVTAGYSAYMDYDSSSTAVDQVTEQLEAARIFDEIPLRSSPVEMINDFSAERTRATTASNEIYSTTQSSVIPPPPSSECSDKNYSPPRQEREQYRSRSSTSILPTTSASRVQDTDLSSHSLFQSSQPSSNSIPISGPPFPGSTSSTTSSSPIQGRSVPTLNASLIYSTSQIRNPSEANAPGREGRSFAPSTANGVYNSYSTAPEAYTSTMMQSVSATSRNSPTTIEQASSSVHLTSQYQPSQYSQHIPHSNGMNDASSSIPTTITAVSANVEAAANASRDRRRSSRSRRDSVLVASRSDRSSSTATSSSSDSPPLARAQIPVQTQPPSSPEIYASSNAQSNFNRSGMIRTRKDSIQAPPVQAQPQPHVNYSPPRETSHAAPVDTSSKTSSKRARTSSILSVSIDTTDTKTNNKGDRRSTIDARSFLEASVNSIPTAAAPSGNVRYPPEPQQPSKNHYPNTYEPRRRHTDESNPSLADATRLSATPFRSEFIPSVSMARAQAQSMLPEPTRSRSDGDQIPLARQNTTTIHMTSATTTQLQPIAAASGNATTEVPINPARRAVRWNQRLVCPSPVRPDQRRKGWFNRRGDQLWTNAGSYKAAPLGEQYPVDLDDYPEFNEGWMNEEGVRIDMNHRLIPKPPLRSALKRTSQGFN
ncbi:hypothetical protein VKT23_015842 [Stygiomarasmius scandens]|uniref:Uncharacterized protein n=1 Tax=Marasmiellus scandens TaxID=2682957 RepID=A0ABR1IZ67_9AGAR